MAELGLAVTPIIYKALVGTWSILDDTLSFSKDSEDLMLQLENIRAHLSIWASRSGLDNGELRPNLHPFNKLIAKTLKRIRELILNVTEMGNTYGLVLGNDAESKPTAVIVQMRRCLETTLENSKVHSALGELLDLHSLKQEKSDRNDVTVSRRLSWAIRDKKKFASFLDKIKEHVGGLHKLLPETEQKVIQQEEARYGFQVIQGLSNIESLSLLQSTPGWYQGLSEVDVSCLANWKAINLTSATLNSPGLLQHEGLSVGNLGPADRRRNRFVKKGRVDAEACYLFEKKEYDMNIKDADKDLLKERLRKLVSLLGSTRAQAHLHTMEAVDYMDDPEFHCWWIVFRFPLLIIDTFGHESEPLSLRGLYTSPYKPALEQRYALARRLATTFANLFGSNWMHKNINSANIVFPQLYSKECVQSFRALNTALVQGFAYSRQHTEAQTIDRGKVLGDLQSALYRHPNYQGEAASGYQNHYDIYSLGLVFFELAFWAPVADYLALQPKVKPPVDLAPKMTHFHQAEAVELKRRVMIRVDYDLAHRVGTKFADVVRWCLQLNGPVSPIEFYNTVVIPLDDMCN